MQWWWFINLLCALHVLHAFHTELVNLVQLCNFQHKCKALRTKRILKSKDISLLQKAQLGISRNLFTFFIHFLVSSILLYTIFFQTMADEDITTNVEKKNKRESKKLQIKSRNQNSKMQTYLFCYFIWFEFWDASTFLMRSH